MPVGVESERSDEVVHDAIAIDHRALCAAHAALLADVGALDRGEAWQCFGARSMEDYLVRHHQLGWATAKDWVREAWVLARHPELAASYAAGTMSGDKLAAACRLAEARDAEQAKPGGPFDDPPPDPDPNPNLSPDSPPEPSPSPSPDPTPDPSPDPSPSAGVSAAELLGLIAQLMARQLGHLASHETNAGARHAAALYRRRHAHVTRQEDQRRLSVTLAELFDDQAATVWAAFSDYAANSKPNPVTGLLDPLPVRYADALVAMASAYLAAREKVTHRPMVIFHADARVLAGEDGWAETSDYSPLAAETARRLACACRLDVLADDPDGRPLNMGRAARDANWQQTEACLRRDGGCRMCGSRLFLHTHHIRWWERDHGPTDLDNLITICGGACHHHLHEGGWTVTGHPEHQLTFTSPTVHSHPHPQHPPGRRHRPRPPGDDARPDSCHAGAQLW